MLLSMKTKYNEKEKKYIKKINIMEPFSASLLVTNLHIVWQDILFYIIAVLVVLVRFLSVFDVYP